MAIQDLGEANPQRTTLDDDFPQFFNTSNSASPPSNDVNKLNPDEISFGGILNQKIRDIATANSGFES